MWTQMRSIPKIKLSSPYLERVVKTKSLGLIIDDNLRWKEHINYICSKTKWNVGIISRQSLVKPYFMYGNTVWGLCNDNLIDMFQLMQNRVARIITDTTCDSADNPLLYTD